MKQATARTFWVLVIRQWRAAKLQVGNGKSVVWGPVVWDSNRVPLRIPIPFIRKCQESKPPGPKPPIYILLEDMVSFLRREAVDKKTRLLFYLNFFGMRSYPIHIGDCFISFYTRIPSSTNTVWWRGWLNGVLWVQLFVHMNPSRRWCLHPFFFFSFFSLHLWNITKWWNQSSRFHIFSKWLEERITKLFRYLKWRYSPI